MEDLADSICDFIKEQANDKGVQSLIVRVSGGIDTAVSAALCVRTDLPTILIIENGDVWGSGLRCKELVKTLDTNFVEVNLEKPFNELVLQIPSRFSSEFKTRRKANRALKSTLKTSMADYIAKLNNGIIVGAANKDEDMFIRCYHRRGSGNADIQPLASVHKSEIYELARFLEIPDSILTASSSTDVWGGDETRPPEDLDDVLISSVELEWARKEADAWLKAFNDYAYTLNEYYPPTVEEFHEFDQPLFFEVNEKSGWDYQDWPAKQANDFKRKWTERQQQIMSKVIQLEFSSRHKVNPNIPCFKRNKKYNIGAEAISMQDFCGGEIQGHSIVDPTEENADRWL